jgi:hypothetical protein
VRAPGWPGRLVERQLREDEVAAMVALAVAPAGSAAVDLPIPERSAPWSARASAAIALGVGGAAGLAYSLLVVRRARRQTAYVPVLEDWIWHNVLPLIAYAALLLAALLLQRSPAPSLFVIGGTALLLLFVGIHNAWDAVTYTAFERRQRPQGRAEEQLDPRLDC